ncbi:MAG: phage tail sheath subtilisin-like domain-containing protein, partial [Anaerolineales bacterium]|nr:phage tail sheath subtilisin-like domain-containing protein [Anaerolineales bacterium]
GQSNLIADVVDEINDYIDDNLPGGFVAVPIGNNLAFRTDHFGRDARILVKTVASYAIFGFTGVTVTGKSPESTTGVQNDHAGIITGATATGTCFTLMADSAGIEGNNTQVTIANEESANTFVMEVYSSGVQVESWGNLTKNQASRYYVETFLALVSDFIRVDDNTATSASPADSAVGSAYTLVGGSDGIPADPDDQDDLLIGNEVGFTGMYALSEPEQIDIDLIATPGHSSTAVIIAMLFICQSLRMDCLAIVDPPFGLTVNEIVQWQNGTHPLNSTRFDSDFGALYWPWVKIADSFNGVNVWVPPSGSVMAVYARSDNFAAPWFAPAGTTRGVVPGITDVFSRPTLEERDSMYGQRNAVNPIVQFSDAEGFLVWGQKTLQRTPTALDRVNVRRLMFVVEKRIRQASRRLLFDPHDDE